MCEEYNGWTNRETWAVALYINNDQGWQESVLEALHEARAGYLADNDVATDGTYESRPNLAGEVVRENVEEALHEWYMAIVAEGGANGDSRDQYESCRDDIGSLYRVDWAEIGESFLTALDEERQS